MAKAVTIVDSGGIAVTNLAALMGLGVPMTPVDLGGVAVTLVDAGGLPVVLINEDGTLWNDVSGIVLAANGALYDPSDLTSLYQSRTGGSTGATGQPVGIMLDKSYMGGQTAAAFIAGQVELIPVPDPAGAGWVDGPNGRYRDVTTVADTWYRFQFSITSYTSGTAIGQAYNGAAFTTLLAQSASLTATVTDYPLVFKATGTTTRIYLYRSVIGGLVYNNASLKTVPGFHALAPSDAARPLLNAGGYLDFDLVDDLLNAIVTNLGTNVSVYYRTQAGAHVWLTGQTIGAGNYALSTTDWRKAAIIPGGVTVGQQATIEAWGAS